MLSLKNVYTGYGSIDIVKNVSFELNENSCLSVIGPNGCGKTTLLKAIVNLLPYKGSIEADSRQISEMKQNEISSKIALLSQNSGIYFSYSVFDTVMMGRYLHIKNRFLGKPSCEDIQIAEETLRVLNLLDVRDKSITKLSGGQLQRVFLARTLVQEPQIILLDEPTNHLDLKYQIELIEYLNDWAKKKNHSVIGVLHDINLAMRLSERIIIMKDGSIFSDGKAGESFDDKALKDVYGTDVAQYMRESLDKWNWL